ncbi:exonuclease domain-containing protein [Labrenzia sp. R5_0]|uniref:exonuclease domain-containing protein n=1 Tax=Labrenzia sp. R5_0 TaxID=2821108 RepID=UPI00336BB59D
MFFDRTTEKPLPTGSFRFIALDVETANNDRASICQVGLACVSLDGSIATWSTYVDPCTSTWTCTWIHGISQETVRGAPRFPVVLSMLTKVVTGHAVFQHSSFDRSAINAACAQHGSLAPEWLWRDSVTVARRAWPELKGNGGHGLTSLKTHLGLEFRHHDGEEDARAAAEVVLRAEAATGLDFMVLTEYSS